MENIEKNDGKKPSIEEFRDKFFYNFDFVSPETYKKIFNDLELDGKTVVELGCGFIPLNENDYIFNLPEKGVNIIPIDKDAFKMKSWNLAEHQEVEKVEADETKLNPVRADVKELPFEDESVDGCVSINLLNEMKTIEEIETILKEVFRVLRDDGFLIISTFGYLKIELDDGSKVYNDDYLPSDIIRAKDIKEAIKKAGFNHIEDVPLDESKIKESLPQEEDQTNDEYFVKKANGKKIVSVKFIEPVAVLVRK